MQSRCLTRVVARTKYTVGWQLVRSSQGTTKWKPSLWKAKSLPLVVRSKSKSRSGLAVRTLSASQHKEQFICTQPAIYFNLLVRPFWLLRFVARGFRSVEVCQNSKDEENGFRTCAVNEARTTEPGVVADGSRLHFCPIVTK